ncbi:MAG: TatD family hydrolase [Candidatus Helarchaeota archaeon]
MPKKNIVPEPEMGLKFIDAHCHLPFPRPKKNDILPGDDEQYRDFFEKGGIYMITSTIDMETLKLTLKFKETHQKNYGYTCGWAPQTVTYTPPKRYEKEFKEWTKFIKEHPDDFLAIGEIGLDFHHAKTLEKRNKQIEELKKIFELCEDLEKPYVLHVRNAAEHEIDRQHPNHLFNKRDGANQVILDILKEFNIQPERVMWHCFSGPEEYGITLPKKGFILSVPSSAYGFNRWRNVSAKSPIDSLVTETDSYYQHPYKRGPVNIPSNVVYSIAAIAYSHNISQKKVSEQTVQNAIKFFNLEIEN